MLALSAKPQEKITIDLTPFLEKHGIHKDVKILVTNIGGNKARLGFDADQDIKIYRDNDQNNGSSPCVGDSVDD
jgi:hypothetical protein